VSTSKQATGAPDQTEGPPLARAVVSLGLVEIVAWGTTVYALAVLGGPIGADTGWSRSTVFAGMTLGLLVSGALSTRVGRATDHHGARVVMALGSVIAAAALSLMSQAGSEAVYLGAWIGIGLAMRMTLYDASFAAMVEVAPTRGRRAIGYLTLFGGLASTVFWPMGHWLALALGWRGALLVFAALHLLVSLPLVLYGLAGSRPLGRLAAPPAATPLPSEPGPAPEAPARVDGGDRRVAMVLFSVVMSANAFVFGAMSAHLVTILEHAGIAAAAAVGLAALKGVAQVAGRVWEILFAQGLSAIAVGRIAIGLLPLAFVVLMLAGARMELALAFTILLGLSNGLVTIVRGAVPLVLFGPEGYGALLGLLAAPQLVASAMAPVAFAALADLAGVDAAIAALVAVSALSFAAMEVMAHWHARRVGTRAAGGSR
jgi:MFS family permease